MTTAIAGECTAWSDISNFQQCRSRLWSVKSIDLVQILGFAHISGWALPPIPRPMHLGDLAIPPIPLQFATSELQETETRMRRAYDEKP